jgi:hypothetical protein
MAWSDDLMKSKDVFERIIKPVLPKLISGDCIPVEGSPEEMAKLLDKRIGIDAMIDKGDIIFGLGSRIQIDSGVWDTFTIRCDRESGHITEYEKLKNAIKNDALRPHFTMHAYVVKDELKSIAIAKTADIMHYIEHHPADCPRRHSFDGERWAEFIVVYWKKLKDAGYPVKSRKFV